MASEKIRDHLLDYMRAVSMRYRRMSLEEVVMLSKLVLFEAARRHDWLMGVFSDETLRANYTLLVELSTGIEQAEQGICSDAKYFEGGVLSLDKLAEGYAGNPAYMWLSLNGSLEGKYEMQTILRECHEEVTDVGLNLVREWLSRQNEQAGQAEQAAATEAQGTAEMAMD